MKKMLCLAVAILCGVLACGCGEETVPASSQAEASISESSSAEESGASPAMESSAPEASSSGEEEFSSLTGEDLERMREYALEFAGVYTESFASVEELDREAIGRNSLFQLCAYHEDEFETDERGYLFVPRQRLVSYVWEHYGIEDYEYPLSDDPRMLPSYNEEKDAYLFIAAGEGFWGDLSIVDETVEGQTAAYGIRLDKWNVETGQVMESRELTYTFRLVEGKDGTVLQAVSAL